MFSVFLVNMFMPRTWQYNRYTEWIAKQQQQICVSIAPQNRFTCYRVKEANFWQAGKFGQLCFDFIHASKRAHSYLYLAPIKRMPFFTLCNEARFPVYIQHFKTCESLETCPSSRWMTCEKQIVPFFSYLVLSGKNK